MRNSAATAAAAHNLQSSVAALLLMLLTRWSEDPVAAISSTGAPGSLAFNGLFYDNVLSTRRGVSTLNWAKHKLNFKIDSGFV